MYVIAGVTGNTGKVVANTLLDAGKKVRVVVRDAAKGAPFAARGAEVAVADLLDDAALGKALSGAQGAYLLIPPTATAPSYRAHQRAVAEAVARAVAASKIPHAVVLSSIAAELPSGTGPIVGNHIAEGLLRAIETTKTTFVRPGYFMENLGESLGMLDQGLLPSFVPADLPIDMAATRDIGELAASLLLEGPGDARTTVVNLGGPAVTMNDAAAALTRIVGKEIRVHEAPIEAVAPTLESFGMGAELAGLYAEMTRAMLDRTIQWEPEHRRVLTKTSIETVLRALLAAHS